jgi:phospholipase C
VRTLGDVLSERHISWAYFGDGFHPNTPRTNLCCNICNPFQYSASIITDSQMRSHIRGLADFYNAVQSGKLPAVSYVKPDGLTSAIRPRASLICSKPSCRSSSTPCMRRRSYGARRRSS